ncbi:ATP-binding protein [Pseudorhodoferax soli]|uniref:ATP-binding protein n=1 Tax=Pseudorhodoferax soli TaxID=545864 RepID=UPI001FE2BBA6|nr:ATP-binding protein [Pseudorhodoferax soli]
MEPATTAASADALERELAWLEQVLQARIGLHFGQQADAGALARIPVPLLDDGSGYAGLVREAGLDADERLVLALALAPHLRPQLLDILCVRNSTLDRGFTEFGGCKGRAHTGFLPTAETAAFMLAGEALAPRFAAQQLLDEDRPLRRHRLLQLQHEAPGEPWLHAALQVGRDVLQRLVTGEVRKPDYGSGFPARRIGTRLGWDDLVLDADVMEEVQSIVAWYRHGSRLLGEWQLDKALKPGYRALFFGPPGTGKTLTATLIGQAVGADVYRIDLSMVVSKYIGETEKNLAQVFDQAQSRRWILFFDEADALFGKRTATSSSNDRYANQEVSYLLQRVEDFPGTVILATNLKANIDEAFARRFQSLVQFPMPDAEQRLRLWHGMLGHTGRLHADVDLAALADRHVLSGGAIANVVRSGALAALQGARERIGADDLRKGIAKELRKEGRTA